MKTIRKGVFETNSSSTHSICICTDEEYDAWKNNEVVEDYGDFIPMELFIARLREDDNFIGMTDEEAKEDIIRNPWEYDVNTLESWGGNCETDSTTYTTKSGEVLHILCYYGYDS